MEFAGILSKGLESITRGGDRRAAADLGQAATNTVSRTASPSAGDVLGTDVMKFRKRPVIENASSDAASRQLLASAKTEAAAPGAFVLSPRNADFRAALTQVIDPKRQQFIAALKGNKDIMGDFEQWETLSGADRLGTMKKIADLQGTTMGFTPPPMVAKKGAPKDGTLGYFAGDPKGGLGSVTVFPDAMAKTDKWTPLVTITHEMEHAHQAQIVMAGAAGKFPEGSHEAVLARAFGDADKGIEQVGGEDHLSYGDYAHLNNEFDSFRFGNSVGSVVSNGAADTSALGFVDAQFDATGKPMLDLEALAAQVGPNGLLDAVNEHEVAFEKSLQAKSGTQTA